MTSSLAYRKNEDAILRGDVPKKYTRILPFIPQGRVFELGSAEGVLACLLAKRGQHITALEANEGRHRDAKNLAGRWGVSGILFVNGKMQANLDRLAGHDVFVGVRSIYYLRDDIDAVFARIAEVVPNVVLCGNRNRADAYRRGRPHEPLGKFNYYASLEGMKDILTRHGYAVTAELTDGDEIVVGQRDNLGRPE